MSKPETTSIQNEKLVAQAFGKQSVVFDKLYGNDTIVQYKREKVRAHVNALLKQNSHILELNAGTGEDAIWFARQGHTVHATDIAAGMLATLGNKVHQNGLQAAITHELCSYTSLEKLIEQGPYDHVFSNFAGLNCTNELSRVLNSLSPLLKQNGTVTMIILPKFCLWEFLLLAKGKIRTAFRRFGGKNGTRSHVEGTWFNCWYYDPGYVKKEMPANFIHLQTEGLCSFVPPSYITGFAEKYPRLYTRLKKWEARYGSSWPWRSIGDYYIISFRKA